MSKIKFHYKIKRESKILNEMGLSKKGDVQTFLDTRVSIYTKPYFTVDTGKMLHSALIRSKKLAGSGKVSGGTTPYTLKVYFDHRYNARWFPKFKRENKIKIERELKEYIKRK